VEARQEGFVTLDSTLEVSEGTRQVHLALRPEPPGILVVLGDRPAQIYVDGTLIVENVQNSRPQRLNPGAHQVRVVLVSGETVEQSVVLRSGERTTFDYSKKTVERRPEGGQ
jgi:D-ribose pyranose/furanose isomerase RbsD